MNRILLLLLVYAVSACTSLGTVKVRDGKTAYETKQYSVAIPLLRNEIRKVDTRLERGRLAYMLAESYKAMQQVNEAADWYLTAYDNSYGVEALQEMAYMLKKAERYTEAINAFKNLSIEIGSPYEYRKDIAACEIAQQWQEETRRAYQVELLPFNSAKADYAPALLDGNTMVFTSDRATGKGDDIYAWTGNNFSDLFQVDLETEQVSGFSPVINTPDNEGTLCFSADRREVYFTRCFGGKKEDQYCKLMVAYRSGEAWSAPQMLSFVRPGINYMHPALSADGSTLYFSSDDPEGYGGYDIYQVERESGNRWGTPRPLSAAINTNGNEQFPTLYQDTLYFASNRHTSIGGLDIFKSYRMANGAWAPPLNLKPPINSGADDFGLVVRSQTREGDVLERGFFTSSRMNGLGGDDLYRYEKRVLPPPPEPPVVETEPEPARILLDVYVLEKIFADPLDPNSDLLGRRPLPEANLRIIEGTDSLSVTVDEEGRYELEIEPDAEYNFLASKTDYLRNTASFSAVGLRPNPDNPEQRYELEIELDKIYFGTEIVLENIYYDLDKAFIRDDAKPTLDALASDLALNPEIRIELSSHTDCRGSVPYNEDLSQRRAQSAVDYLISKGIDRDRLVARGYGESRLAVDCVCSRCTEEQHQENRRTAFKVIE